MVAGRSTRSHCPLSLLCLLSWPEITWSLAACREISPCHSHVMQVAPRAHLPHVHKFSSVRLLLSPSSISLYSLCVCVCKLLLYYDCAYAFAALSLLWLCLGAQEQPTLLVLLLLFLMLSLWRRCASWASLRMDLGAYVTRPKQ